MNYYYDLVLNWHENKAFSFYEWNDTDYLELIKKMPIFKVKHKVLIDLMQNKVKVNEEFLLLIKDKTILGVKSLVDKVEYASLFTDGKNVIAIEFNENKESAYISNLLVDDELNILEISYSLKEYNLTYNIIEEREISNTLRQEKEAKDLINLEINNLYNSQNIEKLKYLYYEYKKETTNNIEIIYNDLKGALTKELNENILKLYYIIRLSYHKV